MVDLTNPNPFVMTHFELVAFLTAVAGVLFTMISGLILGLKLRYPTARVALVSTAPRP